MTREKTINELRKLLNDFGKLPTFSQMLVTIMLVTVSFTAGQCKSEMKAENFRKQYVTMQNEARIARSAAAQIKNDVIKLTTEAKEKEEVITKLTASVKISNQKRETLKENLIELEKILETAQDTVQVVQVQEGIIYNLKDQLKEAETSLMKQQEIIITQRTQVLGLQNAVALSMKRGDTLQVTVDKLIAIKPPQTSRTNKIVIGVLAFAAGMWVGQR